MLTLIGGGGARGVISAHGLIKSLYEQIKEASIILNLRISRIGGKTRGSK